MSDARRIVLLGSTGLVGRNVCEAAVGDPRIYLTAIARRESPLPQDARMQMVVSEIAGWGDAIASARPEAVICALGTTWKRAGEDEATFRAVDEKLVLDAARAAKTAGCRHFLLVSSIGADPTSKRFYLQVKGQVEKQLREMKFPRLDLLRPGLLRGRRDSDRRPLERLSIVVAPLADLFLHGARARYRSVKASILADALLELTLAKARGTFVVEHEAIVRAAGRYRRERED